MMGSAPATLVIGADGLIGRALVSHLRNAGQNTLATSRRNGDKTMRLDLANVSDTWSPPPGVATAYLCAARTSLRECRDNPAQAHLVNVRGTLAVARRLVDAGTFVVFLSSNLVFDGTEPFVRAEAMPNPQTEYGRMKSEAEAGLLALGDGVGIVRVSKILGPDSPLLGRWRSELHAGHRLFPFRDMVFSPLLLEHVVPLLLAVGEARTSGVVQASGSADISYAEACGRFVECSGKSPLCVQPMSWRDSDADVEYVPKHTTLDSTRAGNLANFIPPDPTGVITALASAGNAPRPH
ncbi:MAG: NAD-dependent epimerase/dehydratase family protein [Planctomycetia bacterium]|nr:NAD-dependent epimerase/dehydratase family protein [Planctomycetia bacterium]